MKVYFIGIGGIGVSALAQYYLSKGHEVYGSDLASSETTEYLKSKGVKFEELKDADLVIYSPAVKQSQLKGIKNKCLSYPEALGELTKQYFTITVSGTHGKSTTTSMLGLLLVKAGFDPTVIIGTKLKEFGNTNFRAGKSKYLVIEADEHFASFLNYYPNIIVLTNIEKEHLDYYKNLKNIMKAYNQYASQIKEGGVLVFNKSDKNCSKIKAKKRIGYGLKKIKLQVPGKHNLYNASAILAVAKLLNIPEEVCLESLKEYKGAWRRFEESKWDGKTLISDYGHHPTEIKATLSAIREKFPKENILCVFQPHQKERTKLLFNDFVKAFKNAKIDKIAITDIYDVAGREEENTKISSEKLVKKINKKNIVYIPLGEAFEWIKKQDFGVLLVMGAGDIYEKLTRKLK